MIVNDDPEENVDRADDFFEVYYYSDEESGGIVDSVLVEIPDFDMEGERMLNFNIAPDDFFPEFEEVPQHVKAIVGEKDDGREQMAYVTDEIELALGIYLGYLESHGVDEDEAWNRLEDSISDDVLDGYVDYVDGLSEKERGREMMEQVEEKIGQLEMENKTSPFWTKTVNEGEWREKGLSDGEVDWVRDVVESVDLDPRSCHYTVQGVYEEMREYDGVEYCEGFGFSKWLGRTSRHAWLEIDGCVVDVTWPWHRFDGDDGMYYGTSIDDGVVMNRLESRGRGAIMLLDDSEMDLLEQQKEYV